MSNERLSMRKIQEVLRLALGEGCSLRDVARSTSVSPSTVREYLLRAKLTGLSCALYGVPWPPSVR